MKKPKELYHSDGTYVLKSAYQRLKTKYRKIRKLSNLYYDRYREEAIKNNSRRILKNRTSYIK